VHVLDGAAPRPRLPRLQAADQRAIEADLALCFALNAEQGPPECGLAATRFADRGPASRPRPATARRRRPRARGAARAATVSASPRRAARTMSRASRIGRGGRWAQALTAALAFIGKPAAYEMAGRVRHEMRVAPATDLFCMPNSAA
jgi:hypothetical protein